MGLAASLPRALLVMAKQERSVSVMRPPSTPSTTALLIRAETSGMTNFLRRCLVLAYPLAVISAVLWVHLP